jgi:Dehydratase medium subunit.
MPFYKAVRPSIKIFTGPEADDDVVRQLMLGIEEEGIPFETEKGNGTALEMAYDASGASTLGVGVGVSSREIVLHFSKLEKDHPLFRIGSGSDPETVRNIGTNGARLVKGMPFKVVQ